MPYWSCSKSIGQPIDGKGAIQATERRPIEHPAPGIGGSSICK